MHLILTDATGAYLSDGTVGDGSNSQVEMRYRMLIEPALKCQAGGMVVVHNHPSGDPTPSPSDITMTRSLVAISHPLDLEIIDHIVIGWDSACSIRKGGWL